MSITNERALSLLGSGVAAEAVASALGVTPSYISQLLSDENFAAQVSQLRFETLSKHNERDSKYDTLEDKLLGKLENTVGLLMRPMDILRAIKVVNEAKRRGQSSEDSIVNQHNLVSINMPVQVVQQFTTNIHNQVIAAGEQTLVTVPSGELADKLGAKPDTTVKQVNHSPTENTIPIPKEEPKLNEDDNGNLLLATL